MHILRVHRRPNLLDFRCECGLEVGTLTPLEATSPYLWGDLMELHRRHVGVAALGLETVSLEKFAQFEVPHGCGVRRDPLMEAVYFAAARLRTCAGAPAPTPA